MKNRSTAEAAVLVTVAFGISTVLGFGREVVLAAYFGTTRQADAFLVALLLPNFFLNLLAAVALGSAVVPVFTSHIGPLETAEQRRIIGSAFGVVSLVLAAFAALTMLAAPLLVRVTAPGFGPPAQALTVVLMRVMLPGIFFLGLSNLVTGILHAHRQFGAASAVSAIWNVAIIGATLALAPRFGIIAPAIGVLAGSILQLSVMIPSLVRTGLVGSVGFRFRDPILMRVWLLFLPIMGGALFQQAFTMLEKLIGSFLPPGRIAALSYASKIASGPTGIFGLAISTVFLPSFAKQVHEKSRDLALTISKGLNVVAMLIWPWAAICIALRVPIVALLLQHGAFDKTATLLVALPLAIYSLNAYAAGVKGMLTKAFYSQHNSRTPLLIDLASSVLWVVSVTATLRFLGYAAIPVAAVICINLESAVLLVRLRRLVPDINLPEIGSSLARIAGAAAVGGAVAGVAFDKAVSTFGPLSILWQAAALLGSAILALAIFLIAVRILRVQALYDMSTELTHLLRARLDRR